MVPTTPLEALPELGVCCLMAQPAGADHVVTPEFPIKISMTSPAACPVGRVGVIVVPVPPGLVTTGATVVGVATSVRDYSKFIRLQI